MSRRTKQCHRSVAFLKGLQRPYNDWSVIKQGLHGKDQYESATVGCIGPEAQDDTYENSPEPGQALQDLGHLFTM